MRASRLAGADQPLDSGPPTDCPPAGCLARDATRPASRTSTGLTRDPFPHDPGLALGQAQGPPRVPRRIPLPNVRPEMLPGQ